MYNGFNYMMAPEDRYFLNPVTKFHPYTITQTNQLKFKDKTLKFPYMMATFLYCNRKIPISLLQDFMTKTSFEQKLNPAYY